MNKKIILIIFIVVLFFVLSLFNNVYASDFNYTYVSWDDDVLEAFKQIPEYENLDNYWYNFNYNGSTYPLVLIPKTDYPNLKIYYDGDYTSATGFKGFKFCYNIEGKFDAQYYLYDIENKVFIDKGIGRHSYFYHTTKSNTNSIPILSNVTWYTDSTFETVFFFPGIVKEALRVVEVQELKQIMKEVLAMLPVILSVVVSLIALRKGLQVLLSFLKKS